ncbi:hypothetical protein ACRAWD_21190 [Caulobacter segnis]
MAKLSALICAHNEEQRLPACLAALELLRRDRRGRRSLQRRHRGHRPPVRRQGRFGHLPDRRPAQATPASPVAPATGSWSWTPTRA